VRDVLYEDLRIEELQDDYLIDLHPLGGSTNSVIEGVTFRNIRQVGGKQRPSRIAGRADFPVRNVRVEKLQLFDKSVRTADEGKIAVNPHASNILFSVAQ
jgi:hypothetical protein